MIDFLKATFIFEANHPKIEKFVFENSKASSKKEQAIELYFAVRDQFRYDPFRIRLDLNQLRSTNLLKTNSGHCIDKAVFLISCLRYLNIPAGIGLAKVKNHIGTGKLEKLLQTNVLVPHGYVNVYLNDKWVKCTPAFNKELCGLLNVPELEFDGVNDSIFQNYDGRDQFMEYIEDYGNFSELPHQLMIDLMKKEYPILFDSNGLFNPSKLD